jgi:putative oxidoreductase
VNLGTQFVTPFSRPTADALFDLFLRIALAAPFFFSARTKIVEGTLFSISDTTYTLFENDYSGVPLPPHFAAVAATTAEHLLPLLLLLGLGTRLAALGLLIMTMVIQSFVYPDAWWSVHMQWVTLALAVMLLGPGKLSLDQALFGRRSP